jgi:glycosyltransferase involved in cell wall biosynthesis
VVFPSLYEGFGLPILEAMQLGTAVITGTEGSNPEVSGDGAYLVDPYDVGAIARAIRDMQNDQDMVEHYEARGRERAQYFSPERYSERLAALYNQL